MRVSHITIVTPARCGLYETTRDLVMALRRIGVDSRIVDPGPSTNPVYKGKPIPPDDRGCPIDSMEWALTADVVVSHSGFARTPIATSEQPVIHICHGRPLSTYLSEREQGIPIYSEHARYDANPRIRAVVTFWAQHVAYHQVMFKQTPVYHVPSMVDLEYWRPGGPQYNWGGRGGWFNAVIADGWRDDIDPFNALNAWALWARAHPGAKVHLYGKPMPAPGTDAILKRLIEDGTVGEYRGWRPQSDLKAAYQAADCLITPHEIDTRAVREALACGCPVVQVGNDLQFSPPATSREEARRLAERLFSPQRSAAQFKSILETVLS